ncbi:MAG TPA: hypothetical protein VF026_22250 [Ktedonobacteraceae bacterium]
MIDENLFYGTWNGGIAMGSTQARKQPKYAEEYDVGDDDHLYSTPNPSSARKYKQPIEHDTLDDPLLQRSAILRRRSHALTPANGASSRAIARPPTEERPGHRRFPIVAILLGMVVMALLAVGLSSLTSWWRIHQDDMQYGRPRTFQLDAVVGHNDSAATPTHFIFINLNRHIDIIELPGGDTAHARIYPGPVLFGDGQDLTPVTAEIRDVNGDGKPDIIVHIQDQQLVFINDGTQFRPLRSGEHVNV